MINGRGESSSKTKLDFLKLKLSPPSSSSAAAGDQRIQPSPSTSPSTASFCDMSYGEISSCMSSDDDHHQMAAEAEPAPPMLLAGCPQCLMYLMLSRVDPKCPRCNGTVLLDVLNFHETNKKTPN